jgi:hypothetical protein
MTVTLTLPTKNDGLPRPHPRAEISDSRRRADRCSAITAAIIMCRCVHAMHSVGARHPLFVCHPTSGVPLAPNHDAAVAAGAEVTVDSYSHSMLPTIRVWFRRSQVSVDRLNVTLQPELNVRH